MNSCTSNSRLATKLFFGTTLAIVGIVVALNFLVDPYWIFSSPRQPGFNDCKVSLGDHNLAFKAAEVIRRRPQKILLGSSVVDGGFLTNGHSLSATCPSGSPLSSKMDDIYNLGIRGGSLYEAWRFLLHAHRNNPGLSHVILGIEMNLLTEAKPPKPVYPLSNTVGSRSLTRDLMTERLLTASAIGDSFRVLEINGLNWAKRLDPYRFVERQLGNVDKLWPALGIKMSRMSEPGVRSHVNDSTFPVTTGDFTSTRLFYFALMLNPKGAHKGSERDEFVRQDALELVKRIVSYCREHKIRLDVYFSPQHALFWSVLYRQGHWDEVQRLRVQLAQATPFWDFAEEFDFADKPDMYFSHSAMDGDPLHFTTDVGERIAAHFLGKEEMRLARRVTSEAMIDRRPDVERWLDRHPYFSKVLSSTSLHLDQTEIMPVLYPAVDSRRTIFVLGRRFTLPNPPPEIDLLRLLTLSYPGIVEHSATSP